MTLTLPNYSIRQFRGDLAGGLVAALIALPYGLAMAALMGLPPMMVGRLAEASRSTTSATSAGSG